MIPAKNYETVSKFVNVMRICVEYCGLFFSRTRCITKTTVPQNCAMASSNRMLFGHLARMDETTDARRILTGVHQSDWSRPVGRPYTSSWMASLKSDLSLHNLTFEDAIELAMDKSLWRLLVASGATH